MEIYIEDVIIDNLVIDSILLWATNKILHLNSKPWLLLVGGLVGAILSMLSIIFPLAGVYSFIYKVCVGVLMVLLICPKHNIKKFLSTYFCFFSLTFLCGGACFMIASSFGEISILANGQASYSLSLPMGVIVLIIAIIIYFTIKLIQAIKEQIHIDNFIFWISIETKSKVFKFKGFLDSGNTLTDPQTQKPIIFITYPAFSKLYDNIPITSILLKQHIPNLENMHYISAGTIHGKKDVLVFNVKKIHIWQKNKKIEIKSPSLALTFSALEKGLDCSVLFGPKVFTGGVYE